MKRHEVAMRMRLPTEYGGPVFAVSRWEVHCAETLLYCTVVFGPFLFLLSKQAQTYYFYHLLQPFLCIVFARRHGWDEILVGVWDAGGHMLILRISFFTSIPNDTRMRATRPKPVFFFLGIILDKYDLISRPFFQGCNSYSHLRMGFPSLSAK